MTVVRQLRYRPTGGAVPAVEMMTFGRLRELNDGSTQRADFHVLAVIDGGDGSVSVDFAAYELGDRSAVWIAPGSVHRWTSVHHLSGQVVLFVPTATVTPAVRGLVAAPAAAAAWRVPDEDWPYLRAAARHLELELAAPAEAPPGIPELLLSALVARLAPPPAAGGPDATLFGAFRAAVEEGFRVRHDATHYASVLRCSPRTLYRAVVRATGRTAKDYITDRLALEAKRLLAHDRLTAARCASELGFLDASGFSVFFRDAVGERPGAWQRRTIAG